jgi:hypothetical protein
MSLVEEESVESAGVFINPIIFAGPSGVPLVAM